MCDMLFQRWLGNTTDENKEKFNTIRNKVTKDIKKSKLEHIFEKLGASSTIKNNIQYSQSSQIERSAFPIKCWYFYF